MYDKTFKMSNSPISISTGDAVSPAQFVWSHYLKLNKKVAYDDGAAQTKGDTYRVFALAYDNQATSTSDQVVRHSYFRRTVFQDS